MAASLLRPEQPFKTFTAEDDKYNAGQIAGTKPVIKLNTIIGYPE